MPIQPVPIPSTPHPLAVKARQNAPFASRDLGLVIFGGERALASRERMIDLVNNDVIFKDKIPPALMNREDRLSNVISKTAQMVQYAGEFTPEDRAEAYHFQTLIHGHDSHPFSLHFVMFLPTLQSQMTDEQQEKWMGPAMTLGIVGTYAQTELGHGTNIRALETTATFDHSTDEFILHSPTLSSTKCWPGQLGKVTNYCVLIAQLIIKGVKYGTHSFLVQLRDLDTHEPMNGVTIGDIGPKFGYATNDNGFLRLNQVRIPRDQMLMRYAKVDRQGVYKRAANERLGYGTMLYVRSIMICDQAFILAEAATIACRYSTIRTQGEILQGSGEVSLMSYGTQRNRLMPALATAFSWWFVGLNMRDAYNHAQSQKGDLGTLADLHALASGVKACCTWDVCGGIEQCRQACGGHGYAMYSGLPDLYTTAVAGCTYEGDNLVMLLQTARYLMKACRDRTAVGSMTSYIHNAQPGPNWIVNAEGDCADWLVAFEHAARLRALHAKDMLDAAVKQGMSAEEAWAKHGVLLTKAARSHTRVYQSRSFVQAISNVKDARITDVLWQLARVQMLSLILRSPAQFIQAGMSVSCVPSLERALEQSCTAMSNYCLLLTDAWAFTPAQLGYSCLGREDGHVYAAIINWFAANPMNNQDVLPSALQHLVPLMKEQRAKL